MLAAGSLDIVVMVRSRRSRWFMHALISLLAFFEILAVDAFLLRIAVDVIDEDDGGDGYDGKQTHLPEQILRACIAWLIACCIARRSRWWIFVWSC